MIHDPFCPLPFCDYGEPDGECMGYEDCWHHCVCDIISEVRADERKRETERRAKEFGVWHDEQRSLP